MHADGGDPAGMQVSLPDHGNKRTRRRKLSPFPDKWPSSLPSYASPPPVSPFRTVPFPSPSSFRLQRLILAFYFPAPTPSAFFLFLAHRKKGRSQFRQKIAAEEGVSSSAEYSRITPWNWRHNNRKLPLLLPLLCKYQI